MKLRKRTVLILIIVGFFVYVSSQNTQSVTLHFLFWDTTISLLLLIYITFILGIISGYLSQQMKYMTLRRQEKKEKALAKKQESETLEKKKRFFSSKDKVKDMF